MHAYKFFNNKFMNVMRQTTQHESKQTRDCSTGTNYKILFTLHTPDLNFKNVKNLERLKLKEIQSYFGSLTAV